MRDSCPTPSSTALAVTALLAAVLLAPTPAPTARLVDVLHAATPIAQALALAPDPENNDTQ